MLKEWLKRLVRVLSPPFIRNRPIAAWPGWLGRLNDVKVPAALPKHSQPSPTGQANINILVEMIERTKSLKGSIADCGVYKAASTIGMALYMREHGVEKQIYAFDSFQGFAPETVAKELALGGVPNEDGPKSDFGDITVDEVKAKIHRFRIGTIELVPGFFSQSFKAFPADVTFSFVHLDVNLYDSYCECLVWFYPKVEPGGIILFDEYNDPPWPGCNRAVDEFLADKPEHLEVICLNNYQKWYLLKQ